MGTLCTRSLFGDEAGDYATKGTNAPPFQERQRAMNNDNDIVCHILAAVNGLTFEAMFWLVVIIAVCEFCGLALLAIILRRLIVKTS